MVQEKNKCQPNKLEYNGVKPKIIALTNPVDHAKILDEASDPLIALNSDYQFTYANKAFAQALGKTLEVIIGNDLWGIYQKDGADFRRDVTKEVFETGQTKVVENIVPKPSGNLYFMTTFKPIFNEQNIVISVVAIAKDITDRKQAEEELLNSEEEKSAILNTMSELVVYQDINHNIIWSNKAAAQSVNQNVEDLKGRKCYEIWAGRKEECEVCPVALAIEAEKMHQEENTTPDGKTWLISGYPIKNEIGENIGAIEVTSDITDRKRAEEALKESEEKYRNLIVTTSEGFWLLDSDMKTIDINQSLCDMLGYSRSEMIGKMPFDFVNDESLKIFKEQTSQITSTLHRTYEIILKKKNGINFQTIFNATSLIDKKGKPAGSFAFVTDITSLKQAEKALIKSENKFRKAFYTIPDSVSIRRLEDDMCVEINPGFTKLFGYTAEEIIGETLIEHNVWDNIRDRKRLVARLKKDGEIRNLKASFKTKKGDIRSGLTSASLIELDGVPHILSVTHDITDRNKRQRALKESETKYRLLADNVNDVIFTFDMDLNYTYVSPSVKTLRGYEPEEVLKQEVIEGVTPSSWDLAMGTFSEVVELEKSKLGEIVMSRTLDLEMIRKDGTTVWAEVRFSFIRDENQQLVNILGIARDITERRQAEEHLQHNLGTLRKSFNTTIQVMVSAVEARDPYMAGHQLRVADLARAIATVKLRGHNTKLLRKQGYDKT